MKIREDIECLEKITIHIESLKFGEPETRTGCGDFYELYQRSVRQHFRESCVLLFLSFVVVVVFWRLRVCGLSMAVYPISHGINRSLGVSNTILGLPRSTAQWTIELLLWFDRLRYLLTLFWPEMSKIINLLLAFILRPIQSTNSLTKGVARAWAPLSCGENDTCETTFAFIVGD